MLDDDDASTKVSTRVSTPLPTQSKQLGDGVNIEKNGEKSSEADIATLVGENSEETTSTAPAEIPPEVKMKLRKLDRLEPRYQGNRDASRLDVC